MYVCVFQSYYNWPTANHMGPKEAYEKFQRELQERELQETLKWAADQPKFIELLKEKNIISEKTKKNLDMPNQIEGMRLAYILEEIRESLSEKFEDFLSVMIDYKHGLETLAQKIENHLDPSNEFVHTQVNLDCTYICIHMYALIHTYVHIRTYIATYITIYDSFWDSSSYCRF